MATTNTQAEDKITSLDINQLQPNPKQPRGIITPESIMELADSVKEHGILEPLIVAHTPAGYQIIAGERRWRASKMAGFSKVPCIVKETNPKGMLEMTLVENVQREDLNPIERAKAFERLKDEFGLKTNEIAKRVGKSPSYISNSVRLLALPDAIKDGLLSNLITEGHARAIQSIDDKRLMIEAYKTVLKESASVRRAEDIARKIRVESGEKIKVGTKRGQTKIIHSDKAEKMQEEIKQSLGDNSKVKIIRTLLQTRINIVLPGNMDKTEEALEKIHQGITSST